MHRRHFVTLTAATLASLADPAGASEPTRKDAEALVRKAAAWLKSGGRAQLIEAVNQKNGEFHKGELYVVVYDDKATILAHPVNPKLVGRDTYDQPDAAGRFFRKDFVELVRTKGSGWVDYKYKNPVSGKVEDKTSYVLGVEGLILVAGVYKS